MARTAAEKSTSINFRMPNSLLRKMEVIAKQNHHDRTAEINGACFHWTEIGGVAAIDKTVHDEIGELQKVIADLEKELKETKEALEIERKETAQNVALINKKIDLLISGMKDERKTLLNIVNRDNSTIDTLCSTMVQYTKK